MRRCSKCGSEFDTTSSYCPPCHNAYQKAYNKKKPQYTNEASKKRRKEVRKFIQDLKNVPCGDCGQRFPYYVMDFDHVRGVKNFLLAAAANKLRSIESVKKEAEKCDVVCANCHRVRTYTRRIPT